MDQWGKLQQKVRARTLALFFLASLLSSLASLALTKLTSLDNVVIVALVPVIALLVSLVFYNFLANFSLQPLLVVARAILHVSAAGEKVAAPDLTKLKIGHQLVSELITRVYQFASQQDGKELAHHRTQMLQATNIVNSLPLPLFVFNKSQIVVSASNAAIEYCQLESSKLFGKPLYESLNMEFSSDRTLESWLKDCQLNKVVDTAYWQRVRVRLPDGTLHQCDMAAYYNKDNSAGTEFIVTMFDRTEQYNNEDRDLSFVSLAVHELRTPLTMLRGYIEVFEDELDGKLSPELADFMHKMKLSAAQLGIFFNNILNVTRVEQDSLTLHLAENNWANILKATCQDLNVKAQIHGKSLQLILDPKLPTVAVDKVSIVEVLNNLVDNALKYGRTKDNIVLTAKLDKNGSVETTIQDHGVGVSSSALPHLFEKFYRNHRTSTQVGGTGLGLYLSRAIIKAHGGEIWIRSKEGQGAVIGFSLLPYSQLAEELKNNDNKEITRGAHGWIKNHSLYRR